MTITLRCSALDDLFACAPSVLAEGPDAKRIGSVHPAAAVGSAVHAMAAAYIDTKAFDIENSLSQHGVPLDTTEEATDLMRYVVRAWDEIARFFETPRLEVVVESGPLAVGGMDYIVRGTCDCLSPVGSQRAIFLDWKTGRLDTGYQHQMNGYAYAIWSVMGRPDDFSVTGIVCFLRHRYYRVIKYLAADLLAWEHDLTRNVLPNLATFRPHDGCRWCNMYVGCAARKAVAADSVNTFMFHKPGDVGDPANQWLVKGVETLSSLTPESKGDPAVASLVTDLLFRMRLAQRAVDALREMLRSAVDRVGAIPLDATTLLDLVGGNARSLDPGKAMKVLRTKLTDAQICAAMRMSLPKLLDAYAAGQPRGVRAVARNELETLLADAGAISISQQGKRLEEVLLPTKQQPLETPGPSV